jgi:hypothetical protein
LARHLGEAIATVEEELRQVVRPREGDEYPLAGHDAQEVAQWVVTIERLHTIPGVGLITALWVVVSPRNVTICANSRSVRIHDLCERRTGRSIRGTCADAQTVGDKCQ